jgi:hypothetical protein
MKRTTFSVRSVLPEGLAPSTEIVGNCVESRWFIASPRGADHRVRFVADTGFP